ncbi:hypothetical protein DMA11_20775 [Marinilabiliaceae bacterium JC017]|nr:hypothetical protein DMA11_20775 [Marinilabiliaceae bacterium JC017]
MSQKDHGARGPAIGYYYQAIYALIQLFSSKNNDAYVSIETFDDVYHEDGVSKKLIQLKHSIQEETKISIKSTQLWKTIKVWCDYLETNSISDGIFTLSTVAKIDENSTLTLLKKNNNDRNQLINDLINEAERVLKTRNNVLKENKERLKRSEEAKKLPYDDKYKGCEAYLSLGDTKQSYLINKITLVTESFTIEEANNKVIEFIRITTQTDYHEILAERIIAWWDREAVKSLTRERSEGIYLSELQEFISRKNAELLDDGFTNDLEDIALPEITSPNPIQKKQLEIISATNGQKRRSYDTEMKARIQRNIWMKKGISLVKKLDKYDEKLIQEWSYEFEDMEEDCIEDSKKEIKGRELLDWSHKEAHKQIESISKNYTNHDLIRGSYQILSSQKRVGWHCDFKVLINSNVKKNE